MLNLSHGDLIAERFRVETLIGEGGIARVYKVRHVRLGSVHAVKILTLIRPSLADRLLLEGRIQAQLRHPNLVRVTDVIEHEGNPCLVMEYVDGSNLQALLYDRGSLPLPEALELFAGVLSAVAAAHDVGVLHRDLKPANILLERSRGRLVPKVSDFGIAKVATDDLQLRQGSTRQGVQMGTPGYMAPEQIEDSGGADHRADIFALGAILYEMLSGKRPFDEDTPFGTLQSTVQGRFAPITELAPDCPPHVASAIARCLERRVGDRFQGCHELADALYADAPALRARIQRLEEAAVPAGLHRPEITDSAPSPVGTPPSPVGTLPTPVDTPDFDGAAGPQVVAEGATLAPPEEQLEAAPRPRALGPSTSGIRVDQSLHTDGAAGSLSLPSSDRSDRAAGPTGVTIGGDGDTAALDVLDEPESRSAVPWLVAVVLLLGVAGGGWWFMNRGEGELDTEAVDAAGPAMGEGVEVDGAEAPAAAKPAGGEPTAAKPTAEKPAAEEPAAEEPPAEAPAVEQPAAEAPATEAPATEAPAAEEPTAEAPAVEQPAAEEPVAEEPAAEEPAAEEPTAEAPTAEAPPAEDPPGDAVALASGDGATTGRPGDETPTAEEAPPEQTPPPPAAPSLDGTWSGEANGRPLTLVLSSAGGAKVAGELRFTQGAIERVARVEGSYDAANHRISLMEVGGASLQFTGVVRGTGMMGTYGRRGSGNLSWSATRQ